MQSKHTLHISENCSNCKYRVEKTDFPYFCLLKREYTGELIKCKEWKNE